MSIYSASGDVYIPQTNTALGVTVAPAYGYGYAQPVYPQPVYTQPAYYYPPVAPYNRYNYGAQINLPFGIGIGIGSGLGYNGWTGGWGGNHRYMGNNFNNNHHMGGGGGIHHH